LSGDTSVARQNGLKKFGGAVVVGDARSHRHLVGGAPGARPGVLP
jgi:hypothetical protein